MSPYIFSFTFGKYFKSKEATKYRKNSCAWLSARVSAFSWCCWFSPARPQVILFGPARGSLHYASLSLLSPSQSVKSVETRDKGSLVETVVAHAGQSRQLIRAFFLWLRTSFHSKFAQNGPVPPHSRKKRKNLPKIFTEIFENSYCDRFGPNKYFDGGVLCPGK